MTVAFPVAMGVALIVAALWNFAVNPGGNAAFIFAGAALLLVAVVLDILAYKTWAFTKAKAQSEPGKKMKRPRLKGVLLSIGGGLLLGSFAPVIQMAQVSDNGLGPYSAGVVFAVGVLFSTFVFNLFFMNLPVQGEPLEIAEYFRAKLSRHGLGVAGGILWYIGLSATLVSARAEGPAQVGRPISYGIAQAGIVIAALCGIFLWRELEGGEGVKARLWVMLTLLIVGIGLSAAGLAPPK
jgi:glucose uptake protein